MKSLLVVTSLLFASPVAAQPHPCDVEPVSVTVASNADVAVLFCAKPSENIARIDVILDDAPMLMYDDTDAVAQGGPSADGYVQFKGSLGRLPPGTHTVVLVVVDDQGQQADPSDRYTFTVKPKPSRAKVKRVTQ